MKNILMFLLLGSSLQLSAQKKVVDSRTYNQFSHLGMPSISNDGKYVAYDIEEHSLPISSVKKNIQSTSKKWKIEIPMATKPWNYFTSDSKYFIFLTEKDSLGILDLKDKEIRYIPNVSRFDIAEQGNPEALVYISKNNKSKLIVENFSTHSKQSFSDILNYWLSPTGKSLLLHKNVKQNGNLRQSLEWINLDNTKITNVWTGVSAVNFVCDFKHNQFAFNVGDSILFYKLGMQKVKCLVKSSEYNDSLKIGSLGSFNRNGDLLCFFLDLRLQSIPPLAPTGVEVWSYNDVKLQSQQENELNRQQSYRAVIRLSDQKIIRLQNSQDEIFSNENYSDVLLAVHTIGNGDWNSWAWCNASQRRFDLVNSKSGERQKLDFLNNDTIEKWNVKLSPEAKYLIYFDTVEQNYFSYNIGSKKIVNLTKDINTSWSTTGMTHNYKDPRGIAGWLPADEAILIYDSFDIWKLDPTGRKLPVNLTNSYGVKHKIVFNIEDFGKPDELVSKSKPVLLNAFNIEDKNNGFYSTNINEKGNPELLTMDPCIYNIPNNNYVPERSNFTPIKAKNANVYIVRRESPSDAPNYFCTSDFKKFKQLTDLKPEKDYNWYTAELHTWKSLDGKDLQGILYKPEDFDSGKKYPVIFYYYERLSDGLNAYLTPEQEQGPIDIPTYVSNGYLVFCPDIYYKIGDPMQGVYDALISAGKYLSTFSFIDPSKLGLQGHSFGGIETNYLITCTNLFAAACSASGTADWISLYGSLSGFGSQIGFDVSQYRMNSTLCENLEGFIKNSAVLHADKVATPLLMMHTKNDRGCPYSNAMEFFLGLRRLGKKVWMLVYSGGTHTVDGDESKDYSRRMMQFFDYYLKKKPAPIWMLDGVSASLRGFGAGLQLDSTGRSPGQGLLTLKEKRKVDDLMNRGPIMIQLR